MQEKIDFFIAELKRKGGYDFSSYSSKSFRRRIDKILVDHNTTIDDLTSQVLADSAYLERVVREITVNTTELFRDPKTWVDIVEHVQQYLSHKKEIAIWSSGCSNGLEIYTLLILFNEIGLADRVKIYGSDLNTAMLEKAQEGVYPYRQDTEFFEGLNSFCQLKNIQIDIDKYFKPIPKDYCIKVKPILKERAVFKQHNLVNLENPFHRKFDLILCRNVLIYFNHGLQEKIFYFFHQQLDVAGALVLGVHEGMLGPVGDKYFKVGQVYMKNAFV